MATDTTKGIVHFLDEFNRKAIDSTNLWSVNSDAGGTNFAINEQTGGVIRGGVDATDNDITNLFGHDVFRLDESPATFEARVKGLTSLADGETYVGLTDSNTTDENPITLGTTDVQTSNATDAVGFAYTGAGTADWKMVAVNNGAAPSAGSIPGSVASPTRANARGATTPVTGTWQTLKVVLSDEGHARFFINGVEQGNIASAVRATVLLNAGIAVQSGGTARSLDVDYVELRYGRRATA